MKKAIIIFSICAGLSVLLLATILLTQPAVLTQAFQLQAATLLFHIAGAILFLTAIKGFRQTLRGAYRFMSAGAAMLLLGVIEIYGLTALGVIQHPFIAKFGIIQIAFILMAVFFYIGISTFAKLIWAKTWLTNYWIVFGGAAIMACIVGATPGLKVQVTAFDQITAIGAFNWVLFVVSATLAIKIYLFTSPFYKKAFAWLSAFFVLTVFNTAVGFLDAIGLIGWYNPLSAVTYLITGLILALTALEFNHVAYAEKTVGGSPEEKAAKTGTKSSIDLLVFVAGLASNPQSIETILDPLRVITASMTGEKRPNEQQQAVLADIYLNLEAFLITKEPLRNFNQNDLRQMIELQFKDAVNEPVFWSKIPLVASHS